MEVFAYLLALVWSILCLILFFKIWGMTNNVEQLTREVHELKMTIVQERQERPQTQSQKIVLEKEEQEKEQTKKDVITHNFKMGDYVTHKKYGGKMKVVGVRGNRINCDRGWFSGITTYDASAPKFSVTVFPFFPELLPVSECYRLRPLT